MDERTRFWVLCGVVIAVIAGLGFALFGGGGDGPDDTAVSTAISDESTVDDGGGDFAEGPAPLAEPAAVSQESGLAGSRAAAGSIRRDSAAKGSGRIMGVVRRKDGSPAAGAAVTARWRPIDDSRAFGYDGGEERYAVTADGDGRFEIVDVADGGYSLRAVEGDFAGSHPAYIQNGSIQDIVITLDGSGRLAGRVVDDSGAPVAGAWVLAAVSRGGPQTALWGHDASGVATDETGAFALTGLQDRALRVVASAEGYAPSASEEVTPDRDNIVLTLGTGGAIAGTVTDSETGEPVAGVKLTFTGKVFVAAPGKAETGSDGTFSVAMLAADAYTPSIQEGPYRIAGGRTPVDVSAGATAERDLTVAVGGVIAGTVVRKPGKTPAGGVTVQAYSWSPYGGGGGDSRKSAGATGSDGTFTIEGLNDGAYSLSPSGPGVSGQVRQMRIHVPKGGRVEGIEVVLPATGTVEGRVLDGSGQPAEGAVVQGADWSTQGVHAVSGGDGRFALIGIPLAAEVKVYASLRDMRSKAEGPLAFDGDGVARTDLRLENTATGSIAGRVVDHTGKGVAGASVWTNSQSDYGVVQRSMATDGNGDFTLANLPPGSYQLGAQKEGLGNTHRNEPVDVAEGRKVAGIELRLGSGETMDVSGVVQDANGRPVAGVQVIGQGQSYWTATTDARGAFTLEKVFGDYLQVTARHEEFGVARQQLNPPQTGIVLRLGPPELVRGRVIDGATGQPVTRFLIGMTWTDTLAQVGGWERQNMVLFTDPEGRFAYDSEGQGFRQILAEAEGYAPALTPAVRDGETTVSLTPGRRVTGRVVDGGGNGVAGAAVFVGKVPDQWARMQMDVALSDASGAFVLTNVAPESTLITAAHANFAPGSAAISPNGDADNVVVEMPGGAAIRLRTFAEGWPGNARWAHVSNEVADQSKQLDADGTALFEDLTPGEYRVSASWQAEAVNMRIDQHWQVQVQAVVADGRTTDVDIALPPMNAAIEGVVTTNGRPAAGRDVYINRHDETGGGSFQMRTGGDGGYQVNPLPAGRYNVYVRGEGGSWNGEVDLIEGAGVRFDIETTVPFERNDDTETPEE